MYMIPMSEPFEVTQRGGGGIVSNKHVWIGVGAIGCHMLAETRLTNDETERSMIYTSIHSLQT